MVVRQGEVFWVDLGPPRGSAPSGRRPVVVVQSDRFNKSRIQTTVVAAVTSNVRLAQAPGNVALRRGEAGLARPSVVNVSQVRTIDRTDLGARIGALPRERLQEVRSGLALLLEIER